MIKLILITNEPSLASFSVECGVERVFVDLERLGKMERQGHLDTLISRHEISDVGRIRRTIGSAELIVRLNPLHSGTRNEIDAVVDEGADTLMLPMYRETGEIETFLSMVDGRAHVLPLAETVGAVNNIGNTAALEGLREVYLGLNDLHLERKSPFMFEPLISDVVDDFCRIAKNAGCSYGFGGIARMHEGELPGAFVLAEHLRLGSTSVILSRTFHRKGEGFKDEEARREFRSEIEKLRHIESRLATRSDSEIEADRRFVWNTVAEIIKKKRGQSATSVTDERLPSLHER